MGEFFLPTSHCKNTKINGNIFEVKNVFFSCMDRILQFALNDFEAFKHKHLFAKPGTSPLNLYNDPSIWNWSQLWNPKDFEWKSGITPMADLAVREFKSRQLDILGSCISSLSFH
jgi:hypothetical protein